MVDLLKNGETAIYWRGETNFPASPRRPISVSHRVWYDQALKSMGGE